MTVSVDFLTKLGSAVRQWPLLACVLLLSGCEPAPETAQQPRPVRVVQVQPAESRGGVGFNAQLVSRQQIPLAFEVTGRVVQRHVDAGEQVAVGQPLVSLETADLQLQVTHYLAQIKVAEAEQRTAEADLERFQRLQGKQFVSSTDLDQAGNRYNASRGRLESVQAQMVLAKRQLAYATVTASFPGWVNDLRVDPGQVVAAGEPLGIIDSLELEVQFALPEQHLQLLKPGTTLSASFWACGACDQPVTVRQIGAAATAGTGMLPVRAALAARDVRLRPGMSAWVQMASNLPSKAMIIPQIAVIQQQGKPAVWVVTQQQDGHVTEPVSVELGEMIDDQVLVINGLTPGQWVVTAGQQLLTSGQSVRLVE